jgi:hypothetical protein
MAVIRILQIIVRIYMGIVVIWALSTWLGGIPGILGTILDYLVWPVWGLFGWASIGPLGLGAVVLLLLLGALDNWLGRQLDSHITSAEPYADDEQLP